MLAFAPSDGYLSLAVDACWSSGELDLHAGRGLDRSTLRTYNRRDRVSSQPTFRDRKRVRQNVVAVPLAQ